MSQPTPAQLALVETGKGAVEKFLSQFRRGRSLGIVGVIRSARKAEAATGVNELQDQADDLRLRRDKTVGNPREYVRLDSEYRAATRRVTDLLPYASGEAEKVWRSPSSLRAIRDDLRGLRDAISAELSRVVEIQIAFSRENGLGALDPEAVKSISPAWNALNEFAERHLDPCLGVAEGTLEDGGSNSTWDPSSASWLLLGCAWRQADVGKTVIGKITDKLTGKGGKATSPTPAPDMTVATATS